MKTHNKKVQNIILFLKIRNRIESIYGQLQKRYLVFIFFVALSTLAWFIRALSDTYTADLNYPVRYTNLPSNRILSQSPPKQLGLRVRSDGFTILSYKLKLKRPLRFDVNSFVLFSLTSDSTSVYTLTRNALDKLTTELSESSKNIEILDISPDTIFFSFSRLKKKKLAVIANIMHSETLFARQHMFNGRPSIEPDSVIISGPASIVDTLDNIYTDELVLENLSDTVVVNINLPKFNPKISYNVKKVKVTIPVDRYTESELDIPVTSIHVPDSLILKIFPKSIHINYRVTLSNFDKVSSEMFKPFIDFNTIDISINSKIKIELDTLPSFIHEVKINPSSVEFLIEK